MVHSSFLLLHFSLGGKLKLDLHMAALQCVEKKLQPSPITSLKGDALAGLVQLGEFQKAGIIPRQGLCTGKTPLVFNVDSGERILCLDGGGIKGLIQIEVLMLIEQLAGSSHFAVF